jgi:NitT/TauT family transport system substrate-binding protein
VSIERRGLHELQHQLTRRDLFGLAGMGLSGLGLAAIAGCGDGDNRRSATSTPGAAVDPPPETTTIRLPKEFFYASIAPLYLAEQFLPAEGFTSVQYIDVGGDHGGYEHLAAGEIDMALDLAPSAPVAADAGDPLVILAGVNNSELVLFGNDRVHSLRDLKGKRIHVYSTATTDGNYILMAALLAYVGIDIKHEVEFVELSGYDVFTQLVAGTSTIDAWILERPWSTALRNANIGHVILDGPMDAPWSQYFSGMVTANKDFVEMHPAATKRALRAILNAADMCAREPERAARYLMGKGLTPYAYDEALDALTAVSYAAWREFNPEDTMRFYALRLKEAGLVKSTPDELIARATDWRYLDEIKRELGVT